MERTSREKAFYFFTSVGNYIGVSASSLEEFWEQAKAVDARSLEFHVSRGDFERWFREVWGREELAKAMKRTRQLKLRGEDLRSRILKVISGVSHSREGAALGAIATRETTDLAEYLKQLPLAPREHAYELALEQRLKKMLREKEEK